MIDVDVTPLTREQFDALSPEQQGYVSYMQAMWPNSQVPDDCPYPMDSVEANQWQQGRVKASIACTDMED